MTKRTLFMNKEHQLCFSVPNQILSYIERFQKVTINTESYLVVDIENRLTSLGEDFLLERLIIIETESDMKARIQSEMNKNRVIVVDSSKKGTPTCI